MRILVLIGSAYGVIYAWGAWLVWVGERRRKRAARRSPGPAQTWRSLPPTDGASIEDYYPQCGLEASDFGHFAG